MFDPCARRSSSGPSVTRSPRRDLRHDARSTTPTERNWGTLTRRGEGRTRGREHARIIPVGMASVCGETERLCVAVAVVVVVVAVTNVSPSVRRLTTARDCFTTKKFKYSPSFNETIFLSVEGETRNRLSSRGRGNASRIHVVSRIGERNLLKLEVGWTTTRG